MRLGKLRNFRALMRPREFASACLYMRNQNALSTQGHMNLTADALLNASRFSPDGGYSMAYSLYLGWAPGYIETTGYIVPTALDIATAVNRDDLRNDALSQGEWLLSHQNEDGSFPDASRRQSEIFDTGQVLLGLTRLYAETSDDRYRAASNQAAKWLAKHLADFAEGTNVPIPSYNTRSAAAILEFGCRFGNDELADKGRSFLSTVLRRKLTSGLFRHSQLGDDTDYLLHTIVYVLEGFLHAHAVLGEQCWLEAAVAGAEPLKRICLDRDIIPYSFYDEQWTPTIRERCLTGVAQWSGVCLTLFQLTGDETWRDCGSNALYYVKSKQIQLDGQLRGAIPGSVPIWGRYLRMSFPNWNLKFFGDALLKWRTLGQDDGLHQEIFVRCAHACRGDRIGWTKVSSSISEFDLKILGQIDNLLAPLAPDNNGTIEILDLGCGEGRYMKHLAAAHPLWRVTGVDPIPPSCNDLSIELGSALRIPRGDSSIQGVYASIALQHVDNPEAVLREVLRVLRPGGLFVVFDRNPYSLRGALKPWHELKGRWLYEWDAPFRERWHTPAAWYRMFTHAGFEVTSCKSLTDFSGRGLRGKLPINRFMLISGQKPQQSTTLTRDKRY